MTSAQPKVSQPNPVRDHVAMIHKRAEGTDGVLVVSAFNANLPDDKGIITHHRPGDVDGMVEAIEAHSDTPGVNVYCGLQVMRRGIRRGHRGTETDIVAVLGLVADMDSDTGNDAGEYPLQPNYVIETSPGNFQPFWLLDRPLPPSTAKDMAKRLKAVTGSDHGTADIAHVWRVPGTLNWPSKAKLERGRSAEPARVQVAEPWNGSLTDPTALALSVAGAKVSDRQAAPVELGELPEVDGIEVSATAAELLAANGVADRSEHACSVVERLAFDGHSAEVACALFLSAAGNWKDRYRDERHARGDFSRCWAKYGTPHAEKRERASKLVAGLLKKAPPVAANDNRPATAVDAQTLLSMSFPPVAYVVPGLIAEGLSILGGRPKLGKSWLALGIGIGVATGRPVLGNECEQGDVLYLALEDNRRRLQDRIKTLLPPLKSLWPNLSRLELDTEAPKIDAGLIERLNVWRQAAANPRLVIIDTLAMVRPAKKRTQDSYEADYAALSPLQKWAGEHRLAVVVVTHVRKMEAADPLEMISGTNGLTGAADSILVLNRDTDGPKLYGRGRDLEDIEKAMRFDAGKWSVLGDAVEVKRSAERREVLAALDDAIGPMSPAEIAKVIGKPKGNLNVLLTKMVKDGEAIKIAYGLYVHPGKTGKTDKSSEDSNHSNQSNVGTQSEVAA